MKMSDWPKCERPREKLLQHGAATLSDAELLAILIQTGNKNECALTIAHKLLSDCGSVRNLLSAPSNKLLKSRGIGLAKIALLKASRELNKRAINETCLVGQYFTSAEQTALYLRQHLSIYKREIFSVLTLDSQHKLIKTHDMFKGTINSAAVYPREIVKQALEDNAAAVILAHNHPSGNPQPSESDKQITSIIKEALSLVDISLLDHFVIGHGVSVSLAQQGLI